MCRYKVVNGRYPMGGARTLQRAGSLLVVIPRLRRGKFSSSALWLEVCTDLQRGGVLTSNGWCPLPTAQGVGVNSPWPTRCCSPRSSQGTGPPPPQSRWEGARGTDALGGLEVFVWGGPPPVGKELLTGPFPPFSFGAPATRVWWLIPSPGSGVLPSRRVSTRDARPLRPYAVLTRHISTAQLRSCLQCPR